MKGIDENGKLTPLSKCYIVASGVQIIMDLLPDISDSQSAMYNNESAPGRSMPFVTFGSTEARNISWTCHFLAMDDRTARRNIGYLRILQSVLSPKTEKKIYSPPPVCQLKCGIFLGDEEICAILRTCSVRGDRQGPWSETDYIPYKLDIDTNWEVVRDNSNLPGQEKLMRDAFKYTG